MPSGHQVRVLRHAAGWLAGGGEGAGSKSRRKLNGRFWGHHVGEDSGVPRTTGAMASSGGGPSRVIYHPGQRRFWCNGGGALRARGQGPTLLSSETPQTSSCGEAGAREISGVCRPFRDPSHLPRLPNMLNQCCAKSCAQRASGAGATACRAAGWSAGGGEGDRIEIETKTRLSKNWDCVQF